MSSNSSSGSSSKSSTGTIFLIIFIFVILLIFLIPSSLISSTLFETNQCADGICTFLDNYTCPGCS